MSSSEAGEQSRLDAILNALGFAILFFALLVAPVLNEQKAKRTQSWNVTVRAAESGERELEPCLDVMVELDGLVVEAGRRHGRVEIATNGPALTLAFEGEVTEDDRLTLFLKDFRARGTTAGSRSHEVNRMMAALELNDPIDVSVEVERSDGRSAAAWTLSGDSLFAVSTTLAALRQGGEARPLAIAQGLPRRQALPASTLGVPPDRLVWSVTEAVGYLEPPDKAVNALVLWWRGNNQWSSAFGIRSEGMLVRNEKEHHLALAGTTELMWTTSPAGSIRHVGLPSPQGHLASLLLQKTLGSAMTNSSASELGNSILVVSPVGLLNGARFFETRPLDQAPPALRDFVTWCRDSLSRGPSLRVIGQTESQLDVLALRGASDALDDVALLIGENQDLHDRLPPGGPIIYVEEPGRWGRGSQLVLPKEASSQKMLGLSQAWYIERADAAGIKVFAHDGNWLPGQLVPTGNRKARLRHSDLPPDWVWRSDARLSLHSPGETLREPEWLLALAILGEEVWGKDGLGSRQSPLLWLTTE